MKTGSFDPLPEFEDPSTLFKVEQFTAAPIAEPEASPPGEAPHPTDESPTAAAPFLFSESDLMSLTEAVWSLPSIVWDKIPPREPEQLKPFNKALHLYCMKKGIDPFALFFDEFPLVMATIGVGGGIYRDYKDAYPKKEKNKVAEGDKDYEHNREVDEQRERDFKE